MKPNGKNSVVRVVVLALCVVCLFSNAGQAQTTRGTFKLPVEAHWGKLVLAPGEYEFSATDALAGRIIVRSTETGWSGMVLASDASQLDSPGTRLVLMKSDTGIYVKTLYLGDSGVVLNYGVPKAAKTTRLSPQPNSTMVSASGAQ